MTFQVFYCKMQHEIIFYYGSTMIFFQKVSDKTRQVIIAAAPSDTLRVKESKKITFRKGSLGFVLKNSLEKKAELN